MEKSPPQPPPPPPYYDPEAVPPKEGYPPQMGYPPQAGFPQQPGYPPQPEYIAQSGYPGQSAYPSQPSVYHYESVYPGYQNQNITTVTVRPVVNPSAPDPPGRRGWCEENQRNKPQSNTLAAATLIFTCGGMNLAWSVGFAPTFINISSSARTHMQICWYIAVIIGTLISALLVPFIQKRMFYIVASALLLLEGILLLAAPYNIVAVDTARYCDGIAFGLSLIPAIVAGSEVSVKTIRARVLSIEQLGLVTGIMSKTVYMNFWSDGWDFNSTQMQGILILVYCLLSFLFIFCFTIESPVFFLIRDNEIEATNSLRRLQKPQVITSETYELLNENKRLVEEDKARGLAVNISTAIVPMAKMCLFRGIISMSFTIPLTLALQLSSVSVITSTSLIDPWTLYFYAVMRLIGVIVVVFTGDGAGRKIPTTGALIVGGGLMIAVGAIFSDYWNVTDYGVMDTAVGLLLVYQLCAGMVAPIGTCFLGEAFSISVKPFFIFIVVLFESLIHIIIYCTFNGSVSAVSDYAYALGILQILFAVLFFIFMPETKQTTLREALDKFKKVMSSRNS